MKELTKEFVTLYKSPDADNIFCCSPGIARAKSGRLIATTGLRGPGMDKIKGVKARVLKGNVYRESQWMALTSDDRGKTWTHRENYPFMHARPFVSGQSIYVLGQCNDLMIIRSDDGGETWTEPVRLTEGEHWHQAPCNVHYSRGNIYIVMEKLCNNDVKDWPVSTIAPVLMRANVEDDLTKRESWTFASELIFRDAVKQDELDFFGVPFYKTPEKKAAQIAPRRYCAPLGWLETNIVQFVDHNHNWYDPSGHTFHLWMRAHTGGTGYAAIAKVVEKSDGSMETMLETVPSGKRIVYVPCPGGQMKFHILYDDVTKLYWLLSTQATDSMTRAECLPEERYGLPDNERQRLQLHFSKNCIDWCFAGLVAKGEGIKHSRHYASMVIDGDDLHILSRSGDENAMNAHNGNFISFHTVKDFRNLVY